MPVSMTVGRSGELGYEVELAAEGFDGAAEGGDVHVGGAFELGDLLLGDAEGIWPF